MRHAGFVLTGGGSSRMGRDKALLPYGSGTLAQHAAEQVLEAAGNVTLIGDPTRYGHLGYRVFPDRTPASCHSQCGPMGGIYTALSLEQAAWNLILACDLPHVRSGDLHRILEASDSARETAECVVPWADPGGPQPVCAAYHSRCLPKLEGALKSKRLKMLTLLGELEAVAVTAWDSDLFLNVNTPADWGKIALAKKP